MLDEREKQQKDLMDYVRGILFGYSKGETLATYWKKHNTDYATVDVRFGVKATKEVAFQFMVNNLLNKEYSNRPMAVAAPRTFVSENGRHFLTNFQDSQLLKKRLLNAAVFFFLLICHHLSIYCVSLPPENEKK